VGGHAISNAALLVRLSATFPVSPVVKDKNRGLQTGLNTEDKISLIGDVLSIAMTEHDESLGIGIGASSVIGIG
jgi:hypothetical protein